MQIKEWRERASACPIRYLRPIWPYSPEREHRTTSLPSYLSAHLCRKSHCAPMRRVCCCGPRRKGSKEVIISFRTAGCGRSLLGPFKTSPSLFPPPTLRHESYLEWARKRSFEDDVSKEGNVCRVRPARLQLRCCLWPA